MKNTQSAKKWRYKNVESIWHTRLNNIYKDKIKHLK